MLWQQRQKDLLSQSVGLECQPIRVFSIGLVLAVSFVYCHPLSAVKDAPLRRGKTM